MAAILKNFPSASIKIGGNTDNTGDAGVDKKPSDARAKVVPRELAKSGAGSKQVAEAVGYGPDHRFMPPTLRRNAKRRTGVWTLK